MSPISEMQEILRPATDADGHPISQRTYDALKAKITEAERRNRLALEAMKEKDKAAHSLASRLCRIDVITATACRDLIDRDSAMALVAAWRREWDVICKTKQDAIKEIEGVTA